MAHISCEFYPKSLARKTNFDLVIPSLNLHGCLANKDDNYYQNKTEKYPLIIFLHGFGDNKLSWQRNTQIINLAEKYGFAACFINGENKWYLNAGVIDDFYSYIERDLLDYLYGTFSQLSKDKPLVIAGVSMGGYGALYHYLNNINKFDACIALSPATKPDQEKEEDFGLKKFFLEHKREKLNIYLSIGTNDFIIEHSRELDNYLKENNIDCHYEYVEGCDHSWVTWDKEMDNVISFLKEKKIIK